jgi:hypothetical protein
MAAKILLQQWERMVIARDQIRCMRTFQGCLVTELYAKYVNLRVQIPTVVIPITINLLDVALNFIAVAMVFCNS